MRRCRYTMEKYRKILSAVHMVYRLVNSTYNVKELSLRLTRLLCQFIQASAANVYLLDREKKRIILIASFDNKINILIDKKPGLRGVSEEEKMVARGASIFKKHFLGLPLVADDSIGLSAYGVEKVKPRLRNSTGRSCRFLPSRRLRP